MNQVIHNINTKLLDQINRKHASLAVQTVEHIRPKLIRANVSSEVITRLNWISSNIKSGNIKEVKQYLSEAVNS